MNERPRPPIAVALHYNVSGSGAPRVVAKGGGEIAEKIIETAREHKVPLQEDAALASALSKLDIGQQIPKELYVAVAHVLAFAWSIAGKAPPLAGGARPENQAPSLPLLPSSPTRR
ncbi:MAG TPA: EscU/YscU/HrcU family type III secretion system export apparatus switch protein [Steroidobacter sp.]|uniref:EscU/YscU/HrcU family type III secretion system export apparatus switch protein n=1 Tax=Steroidobacter sp. TaxID=1978227 RepID=UPI002EDB637F